jgi:hypothetical protein
VIAGIFRKAYSLDAAVEKIRQFWWAHKGSNLGPLPCEGNALPLSYAPGIFARDQKPKRRRIGQYAPSEPAIYEGWAIGVKLSAPGALRQNTKFLSRINVIWVVQSHLQKYIGFHRTQITSRTHSVPFLTRGVSRSSRT